MIKNVWNKLRLYLSFLLLAFYLIIGFLFLFSDIWADFLPEGRAIVGAVLVLYGGFRFFIAYRRYIRKHKHIKTLPVKKKKQLTKETENAKFE